MPPVYNNENNWAELPDKSMYDEYAVKLIHDRVVTRYAATINAHADVQAPIIHHLINRTRSEQKEAEDR